MFNENELKNFDNFPKFLKTKIIKVAIVTFKRINLKLTLQL